MKFIGRALGNVIAHEIGHMIGSFHIDQFNDMLNLMDAGGNFPLLLRRRRRTASAAPPTTPTWTSATDTLHPNEGFTGLEDTLNNSGLGVPSGPVTAPTPRRHRPPRGQP